jgi:hypothetical protein
MTDPLAGWYTHQVTVERFIGTGAFGDSYAAQDVVLMAVDDKRRLVRAADGSQVVSETSVAHPLGITAIPPRSKVTLPATFGGRRTIVIASSVGDGGGMPTPDHVELALE